jgi:hypothetical protein
LVWKLDNRYGVCGWADTFKSGSHCNFSGQKSPTRRPLGFVFSIKIDWLTWLRFEQFGVLWRAPGSLANQNTISEVVNLTTSMYSNLLSCLARVKEETKLTQLLFRKVTTALQWLLSCLTQDSNLSQVNESILLEKLNPSWFIPFCTTSSTSGFLWS